MQMELTTFGLCECGCGERTTVATVNSVTRGLVKGQPRRFMVGHARRKTDYYRVEDRGYRTACWVYKLALNGVGYGQACRDGKNLGAHRVEYEKVHGSIPKGMHIDHLCRVPACINPDHLEVVTPAENARRGMNSKLTFELAEQMRADRASGLTFSQLGDKYGVNHAHAWEVCCGTRKKVWR